MAISKIKHNGLKELFNKGSTAKIGKQYHSKALEILDLLNVAASPEQCAGFYDFHPLKGSRKGEFSMHVNGNFVITFTFDIETQEFAVNQFEDYH